MSAIRSEPRLPIDSHRPRADFEQWRIGTKLMVLIVPLLTVVTVLAAWAVYKRDAANLSEKLTARARSLHTQIMADREYYASVVLPRVVELGGTLGADYRRVHGQFPLPATFVREVSELTAASQEGYKANLISPWPINKDKGPKDHFQREGFAYLSEHPTGQFFQVDTREGRAVMRVLMADRASAPSCVNCHNAHPQSPRHDFQLNDLMGGLEIEMPLDQYLQESWRDFLVTVAAGTGFCLVILGIVALGTRQTITQPLGRLTTRMQEIGGLADDPSPQAASMRPGDEVAQLTAAFERMGSVIAAHETELLTVNAQLERRVLERTTALQKSEEQLRHAQKMEAVARLAGGIAHDFNNVLTIITGYTGLLREALGPENPLRTNVEAIKEAGDRATLLTRQLLAFSRKHVIEPKAVDLNALVATLEKMLQRVIGEDIKLVTRLEPMLGEVIADPGQLDQVLMNLAVNARDAMPQGGTLTIETANVQLDEAYVLEHRGAQPGPHVMLAVSDTGCGMDVHTKAHLFEPFYTTKEPGKGTGLGLSTVFGIVQQSSGTIWVYSEPGQGATFKIYFPRIREEPKTATENSAVGAPPQGSETILFVEDEERIRTLDCAVLQANGYTVLSAGDGLQALRICQEHPGPIHLLVTDVVMPQIGGRELAERLAAVRPTVKVLYISGYTDDAVIRHGVLEANTAFLQKPFTNEAFLRKVRDVLDRNEA